MNITVNRAGFWRLVLYRLMFLA